MEHTLLVPPTALVHVLGVSAVRLSARKARVLDATGAIVLTVTRDKSQPTGQDFGEWLKWIQAKAVRQRMAQVSRLPAQSGGQSWTN